MRVQKERKSVWLLGVVALLSIYMFTLLDDSAIWLDDVQFLYNRLYQIADCFRHGYYPFLYYNDIGGIGYGSPIFYGQLTLFPFLPFAQNIELFIKVYLLVCLLLSFFGFRFFLKRISEYATLCSVFYIVGMPFIYLYSGSLPAALLGSAFSWFFFGYCIDFFRDRTHFSGVLLSFFLVYQSNLNSAILALLACFCLFLVYFDRRRVHDYGRLFLCSLALMAYNIYNMLYHIDALNLGVVADLFGPVSERSFSGRLLSVSPVGEYVVRAALHDSLGVDMCCGFMSLCLFVLFVYYVGLGCKVQSRRYRVCLAVFGLILVLAYAVGLYMVWPSLYDLLGGVLFVQFPIRYIIILYGVAIAFLARVIKYDSVICWILIVCILDFVMANPMSWRGGVEGGELVGPIRNQLCNAEFAGSSFVDSLDVIHEYGSCVHSDLGISYQFSNEYNGLSVDCSGNTGGDVITLPKLYYEGYRAIGDDGKVFDVSSGYSNYCQVSLGDYQGVLRLEYVVPVWLLCTFVMQIVTVFVLIFDSIWRRFGRYARTA